jgi:hypothetical protein
MAQRMADGATREQLVQFCQRGVWRCDAGWQTQPSGFAVLDAQLPGGGWPIGAITELMPELAGIGELRLLAPALVALARAGRYAAAAALRPGTGRGRIAARACADHPNPRS